MVKELQWGQNTLFGKRFLDQYACEENLLFSHASRVVFLATFTPKCYVGESNLTPQFISYVDSLTCISSSVNAIVALPSMEHL